MKFCDSRATPISVPRTVARTMPVIDSRSVFERPSTMASRTGWVGRKSLDGIGKPAGWSRKSKPVVRFCASAFSWYVP